MKLKGNLRGFEGESKGGRPKEGLKVKVKWKGESEWKSHELGINIGNSSIISGNLSENYRN